MRFGVGLFCLSSTATSPRHHVDAYRELLEDAREVERLGFSSLWLSEHHFCYDGYCPALLPAAAAVLAVTERLRVATGMLLLPLQRPERLAAMAAELSRRSGGRLELGAGLGYRDVEFDGKGVPRAERVARQRAGLDLLQRAPDVPLWVGSATPAGVRRAGARGVGIGPPGQVVEGLREVAEAGVDDVVFRVVLDGCPQPALHQMLRRLAEQVLPALGAETEEAVCASA